MPLRLPTLLAAKPRWAPTSAWTIPVALLSLTAAILIWVSVGEYRKTIEQEYLFLDAHARIAQGQVWALLRNVERIVLQTSEELTTLQPGQRADRAKALADRIRDFPEIRNLFVVDPSGRVVLAAQSRSIGIDASHRDYFTVHLRPEAAKLEISRPFKSILTGRYSVGFSTAIRDADHRLVGIVVASVDHTYFDSVMKDILPSPPESIAAIVNNEGDIVYRKPEPESHVARNIADAPSFKAFLANGKRPTLAKVISASSGTERLYAYRAVGTTPLAVVVSRPTSEILSAWQRDLFMRVSLFLLAAALIVHLTWLAERRRREIQSGQRFAERLIETANAMMIGVDPSGHVVAVNQATERVTGYGRCELIGHDFFSTLMPRDRFPQAWEAFQRYCRDATAPRAFEAPILTKAGEQRMIAWQNSPTFNGPADLAILSFGIDVTERAQLQQAREYEAVSRRLVAIQEEERHRLAVELHDRTSPNLTILDINLKLLSQSLSPESAQRCSSVIEDASAALADAIASIRAISFDFRPPLLDYAGFWPALEAYTKQFARRTGIAVQITGDSTHRRPPPETEINLFHIAQEALRNCAKHSHAENVFIRWANVGKDLTFIIADDGVGFDASTGGSGRGITMMRQRAEFIGGKFHLDTQPGKGTHLLVTLAAGAVARPDYAPPSQSSTPAPATRPLAKQAVSR